MSTDKVYVAVSSWLLSFYEEAIDQCDHIFALPAGTDSEEMCVLISNVLGTRFWSFMEDDDVTADDFNSCIYHSSHDLAKDDSLE